METKIVIIEGKKYLAIPFPTESIELSGESVVNLPEEDLIVDIKIEDYNISLKRSDVIKTLEKNKGRLKDYKTTFLEWHNEKFAVKTLFELVTKIPKFEDGKEMYNTVMAEKYFRKLGFITKRLR